VGSLSELGCHLQHAGPSHETVIRIAGTLRNPELCSWTAGMLEQLVTLSGAKSPIVDHEGCEARGDDACLFRVMWQ